MRLSSLEIVGFRGFATEQVFDLDADAVVVVGANGNGKTSLFDAVLWAISGRIPRLGSDDSLLVSRFSQAGQARVVVRLKRSDGSFPVSVTRSFDGSETRIALETPDGVVRGREAEGRLIQLIWGEASAAASPAESVATVLTRSVYLQQDLVRQFIDSVTQQERFTAVSELVGAGRVTDLQGELEKAKTAWTKATNNRVAELLPARNRLGAMESRLLELKNRPIRELAADESAWTKWWRQLQEAGINVVPLPMASREAAGAIDAAIKQIDAVHRAAQRRQQGLDALSHDLDALTAMSAPNLTLLRERVAVCKQQMHEARAAVSAEQARVAELRRLQTDLKEKSEQVRALALLALKHLGERCPVCRQNYDVEGTRRRLEGIVAAGDSDSAPPSVEATLPQLLETLASREKSLSSAELELRAGELAARDREAAEQAVERRCGDLGLEVPSIASRAASLRAASLATQQHIENLVAAQRNGEAFALQLSQAGAGAAIRELQREIETTRVKLQEDDKELARRVAAGEQAQAVIEALREAGSRVVTERVKDIEPLLRDTYGRIDVHPAFSVVRFLASVVRGKGRLSTVVGDPLSEIECDSPGLVLSSSQMNALAVCVFLSLNLGVKHPPLEACILDDPLQSLDDINLLGLIDLLRRVKDQRQLCISTHDVRFGNLLARKLRPQSSEQRTIVIELEDWKRTGPIVTTHEIKCDPAAIRLIAS